MEKLKRKRCSVFLIDCDHIKFLYRIIAIDLNKQKVLHANQRQFKIYH